jgi:hypothetical protein
MRFKLAVGLYALAIVALLVFLSEMYLPMPWFKSWPLFLPSILAMGVFMGTVGIATLLLISSKVLNGK